MLTALYFSSSELRMFLKLAKYLNKTVVELGDDTFIPSVRNSYHKHDHQKQELRPFSYGGVSILRNVVLRIPPQIIK